MDSKLLLLGLLRRQEMHGYQLVEYIEKAMATCTDLKKPGAYYLLNRMAQDGWIEERTEQEGNRPPRRVFRLTPLGEQAFLRLERESLAGYQPPVSPYDLGVGFYDELDPLEARALLEQRRAAVARTLDEARSAPAHPGSIGWLVERQVYLLQADLAWTDELLARLSSRENRNPVHSK
jgi:DNA-binding PadR family transcriptional regulator